ncbi:MAG TPA: AAA domain-containing protein [Solirubrobacteraceae bacterium]|nr:AAA domain-containing protein [Solirubrobacteraceae bacterium]
MTVAEPLTFRAIRDLAVDAVEEKLDRFAREGLRGTAVAGDPSPVPALGQRLEVVSTQRRRWWDLQYYAVDVERGAGTVDDRVPLEFVRAVKNTLVFTLEPAARAALRDVRAVRVFAIDEIKVQLAEALRRALQAAESGRLVEGLWGDDPLPKPRNATSGVQLNEGQQQAFAALTRKGSVFVWGPPGTGKTKVITEAVRDALEHDRSVLITSHTHGAVDNVLEGLLDGGELEPGQAIRVATRMTVEKVSPRVREHEFLLHDKAAGAVVGEPERRAEIDARQAENQAQTARTPELEEELKDIRQDRVELDEEIREARVRLLKEANVVACTLASLVSQRERKFDVVIVDEAAAVEPPYLVVAGARAKRTFAIVGDFLQNAPITDEPLPGAGGATAPDDEPASPWLREDVYALAGIRDRASAEAHPRCVPLRRQYRFPSVIAELVNGFCYDGLLESERASSDADGATVTLIDTSARDDRELVAEAGSWRSPLGVDLFAVVGTTFARQGKDIAYVTPYRAQRERARERTIQWDLRIPTGTAHGIQGREFDIVIVDLMQDSRPRWAARADVHGDARQASAAKLLNVAVTRMRQRLYLIGDWEFIQRHDSPGMRALAGLAGHPNFAVVPAADVLGYGERQGWLQARLAGF